VIPSSKGGCGQEDLASAICASGCTTLLLLLLGTMAASNDDSIVVRSDKRDEFVRQASLRRRVTSTSGLQAGSTGFGLGALVIVDVQARCTLIF
jgi:hypothetical protein